MEKLQVKEAFFRVIDIIESEITEFVEGLSTKHKAEKGSLKKWSAKDIFSHLVFWGDHFNSQLLCAKKNEKVPQAGDYGDQINDGVLLEHMDQSFSEALDDFNQSLRKSKEILSVYSADELIDKKLYEFLNGRTILDRALGTFGWHIAYHLSDFYFKEGQEDKATALQEKYTDELRVFPGWEANAVYNLACFYAQNGNHEKAIANLKVAFVSRPDLIDWSQKDSDLDPLREDEAYKALFKAN